MKTISKKLTVCLVTFIALSLGASLCFAADFVPKQGKLYSKELNGVKFHVYTTPIPMAASVSVIIETPNNLIMQDVHQNKTHNDELKALIASLGKPLQRIYISHEHAHHWVGLEMFKGVPVYANQATIDAIREKGQEMLQGLKKQFGEEAVPYSKAVAPENVVSYGEETIDGVRFVFSSPVPKLSGPVMFMEFPDQKVIIAHHLAYVGVHVPMGAIEDRLKELNEMKGKEYNWVIGGHGIPVNGSEYCAKTIDYFTTLGKAVKGSPDVATAKDKMIKAYPNYGGVFLLDALLPEFYKK